MKIIIYIACIILIIFLFLLSRALNKPIYSKMHNVWNDDPLGRKFADACIIIMLAIAFVLGVLL